MNGSDAFPRGVALTPKVIAEVNDLHARIAELDGGTGGRGRKVRQELRMAREAEQDLLRVLGFESYLQFSTVVAELAKAAETTPPAAPAEAASDAQPDAGSNAAPDAASNAAPDAALAHEAEQTEAELLNVLRSRAADEPPLVEVEIDVDVDVEVGETFDEAFELRVRVAALEAELGRAGYELQEMRAELAARAEGRSTSDAAAVSAAAAGLVEATQELRSLAELVREERVELESLGARSRSVAEQILDDARRDAQRALDEAEEHARVMLEEARAKAIEVTREAVVTVAGLRSIAAERDNAPSE